MKLTLAVLIASLGCEAQRSCQERCARNCAGESKDCMNICMVHKCTAARCARGTLGGAIRSWCRPVAKSDALECVVRCNGPPQLSVHFNMQEIQHVSCLVSGKLVANNQVIDKPLECRKPDVEIDEIADIPHETGNRDTCHPLFYRCPRKSVCIKTGDGLGRSYTCECRNGFVLKGRVCKRHKPK